MKNQILLLFTLFAMSLHSQEKNSATFYGGLTKAVNNTSFEPIELGFELKRMMNPFLGLKVGVSLKTDNELNYSRYYSQATVNASRVLDDKPHRFNVYGSLGVAFLDVYDHNNQIVFEDEFMILPMISGNLNYWVNDRLAIHSYLDIIPFVNKNEYVGCGCEKTVLRTHTQLVSFGLGVTVSLGNKKPLDLYEKEIVAPEIAKICDCPKQIVNYNFPTEHKKEYVIVFKYDRPKVNDMEPPLEDYENLIELSHRLNEDKTLKINLYGYASTEGSQEHNLKLSERRVNYVYDYLTQTGVDTARMKINALGELKTTLLDETKNYPVNRIVIVEIY